MSKQINFNNLIHYYKGEPNPKNFINFKGALVFYKKMKDGYVTQVKAGEKQKWFKSDINEIIKGEV